MSMIKEFKAFTIRENAADMAVGVIIGAAFGKNVASAGGDPRFAEKTVQRKS